MSYIIIGSPDSTSAVCRAVFGEVTEGRVENACYIRPKELHPRTPVGRLGLRIIKFCKWRKILPGIFGNYGCVGANELRKHLAGDGTDMVIYCLSTHPFGRIPGDDLTGLRKRLPGCRFVYCLVDGVERTAMINNVPVKAVTDFLRQFDLVVTYDMEDSERYAYPWIDIPVWRSDAPAPDRDADIYFCGRDKRRGDLMRQVYRRVRDGGLTFRCRLVGTPDSAFSGEGVTYSGWVPYSETVREMRSAGCVLELIAEHNHGATLRYKEAVIYNRKLLSNNPQLSTLPYYDPRWMRYFESPEDIDPDWLGSREPVDYGYRGEFSAEAFFKQMEYLYDHKK